MTDPTTPAPDDPAPDDLELVSAYLDGEATDDERARVEGDPALVARVQALAALVTQVQDVPAAPAGTADAHIDAALADLDGTSTEVVDDAADTERVVAFARPEPRPFWQRIPLGAVAAAVVVLALVGAVGLAGLAGDGGDDSATADLHVAEDSGDDAADDTATDDAAGGDTAAPTEEASAFEADDEAMDGAASPDAASPDDGDRPRFATTDELAEALRIDLDRTGEASTTDDADADAGDDSETASSTDDPCQAIDALGVDPAAVQTLVPAVVDDQPVTAVVFDDAGDRRLVVLDDATCEIIDDRTI